MYLRYRGNTYYRHNNQIQAIKDDFLSNANDLQKQNYYLNFKPGLYQYRGVAYLKLMIQPEK